ncbi:MAG: M42 family metallopeptidase [Anaeroplasma sp.]
MNFDLSFFKEITMEIFQTDSPSGFSNSINDKIKSILNIIGFDNVKVSNTNCVEVLVEGINHQKKIGVASHVDTLGLMVRSINVDGTLNVTNVGGPCIPTLDGEYCKIYTRDGRYYSGTILSNSPSVHVYKDSSTKDRNIDNIVVRIDKRVMNKDDVLKLGINNGDYVCYDPKTIFVEDFLKSRFIDDKASACIILTVLDYMKKNNIKPIYDTKFFFTNFEEVGHGASAITDIDEFLAIDMGCVGKDLDGNEYAVSICAKDSSGPYDYDLTTKLINLAKDNELNYTIDIFPYYSSDASAAQRGGLNCKAALIGTGVAASHGMERTHLEGIENTMKLLFLYLTK